MTKSFNLSQNPRDISYTYSGYAPLSIRLAQYAARPSGWRGVEEVSQSLLENCGVIADIFKVERCLKNVGELVQMYLRQRGV